MNMITNEVLGMKAIGDENRRKVIVDIANELAHVVGEHLDRCTRCCPNCEHWRQGPPEAPIEQCGLVNQRPPARIIAFGCNLYKDNIPF